jgi:hypothetical protein
MHDRPQLTLTSHVVDDRIKKHTIHHVLRTVGSYKLTLYHTKRREVTPKLAT